MKALDLTHFFASEPAPIDMAIPCLARGTVGILASEGGVGKSWLGLEICVGVASKAADLELLDLKMTQGKAVIFNAEDPEPVLHNRIHKLGAYLSPETRDEVADNLKVYSLLGQRRNIEDIEMRKSIVEASKGCRLILLDTLTRFHVLDENSNREMSKLLAVLEGIADETGAALLVLHHASKSTAKEGQQHRQQSARGAGALVDNARWAGYVARPEQENAKEIAARGYAIPWPDLKNYIRFGLSKRNYGDPFPERLYRQEHGVLRRVPNVAPKENSSLWPSSLGKSRGKGKN